MALPTEVTLVVGASFRAPITGAASQGYRWSTTMAGQVGAITVTTAAVAPEQDVGVGSYGRELRIDAVRPGRVTVHLRLERRNGRIREEHDITVTVRAAE